MTDEKTVAYTAVYPDREAALADLEALERLHDAKLLGNLDAAVIDREGGLPHVVKRLDRPSYRVVPELFGGGALPREELHAAARNLPEGTVGLVVIAER